MATISSEVGIGEMAGHMARGQGVLFVGAGISSIAGAPTWVELTEPLRKRLNPATNEPSPQLVAQFFRSQAGDHEFFSYLRSVLAPLRPTPAHAALCGLPVRVVVTTNYDTLLESAFRNGGRAVHVIRDEHELALWNENAEVQILKLHGDIDSARSIILTEQDYFRFLHEHPAFRRKLVDLFCQRTVLFLGFSMRDPNVSLLYNLAVHELGGFKRPAYILTPNDDEHLRRYWESLGLRSVPLEGRTPTERTTSLMGFLGALEREIDRADRGCDLLLVEDDLDLCEALALMFGHQGIRVQVATNGYHGLLLAAKLRPRAIVLDIMMPVMDGWEMLTQLRADADLRGTRVVILSAYGTPEARTRATQLGVEAWLQKPIGPDELLASIARLMVLENPGGRRTPSSP